MERVSAAGGALRLPREQGPRVVDYWKRAQAAARHGKVPAGKKLTVRQVEEDEVKIRLTEIVPGLQLKTIPVPVPERVAGYHAVVRRYRDASDRHEGSRTQLGRSLRILQGLVLAAEGCGYAVASVSAEADRYGDASWTGPRDGHIVISIGGFAQPLRISEEGLPSRKHWERQRRLSRSSRAR